MAKKERKIKVRMRIGCAGPDGVYKAGEIYSVPEAKANEWEAIHYAYRLDRKQDDPLAG